MSDSHSSLTGSLPTEEDAYSLGVEQGRILALTHENYERQGEADWPLSNELFLDEVHSDTCIGQVAVPPLIYADEELVDAYCTGVVGGYSDYLYSLVDMDGNITSDHIMLKPFFAAKGLSSTRSNG